MEHRWGKDGAQIKSAQAPVRLAHTFLNTQIKCFKESTIVISLTCMYSNYCNMVKVKFCSCDPSRKLKQIRYCLGFALITELHKHYVSTINHYEQGWSLFWCVLGVYKTDRCLSTCQKASPWMWRFLRYLRTASTSMFTLLPDRLKMPSYLWVQL